MNKNKQRNITDWLNRHGDIRIDKQVRKEAHHINTSIMLKGKIKEYCKIHKLKFERYAGDGFIASKLLPIRAGMETHVYTGKFISLQIKEIGKKRIYEQFACYTDGDIVGLGALGSNYRQ